MPRTGLAIWKRNDVNGAKSKEHFAKKHGTLVDVIDNHDWAWKQADIELMLSERMGEAFALTPIEPSKIKKYRELLGPVGKESNKRTYRPSKVRLDFKKYGKILGVDDLDEKAHSGDRLPLLDGTVLTDDCLIDSLQMDNKVKFEDVKAIATGPCTIGVGGAAPNYLTCNAFCADIVNQTGSITATRVNNTIEGAICDNVTDMNGFDLTIIPNVVSLGNWATGPLMDIAHVGHGFTWRQEGPGNLYVGGNRIQRSVAGSAATISVMTFAAIGVAFNGCVYDNMFFGGSNQGVALRTQDATPVLMWYANMLFDFTNEALRIDAGDGNANNVYEANGATRCNRGIDMINNGGTCRNNAFLGNTIDYANTPNATGRNNADSDGTAANGNWAVGTGNQTNLVAAAQWQSALVAAGNTFMLPVANSIIDQNGTTPTYATTLINGAVWASEIGPKGILPTAVTHRPRIALTNAIGVGL